jgi:hypothetical protein
MQPFATVQIESIKDLVDLSIHLQLFVFRGQADAAWDMTTSLERAFQRSGSSIYSLENTEHWMLHDFKKNYFLHSQIAPRKEHNFEWLALMQHHGGATRLLDFTASLYVAAYFSTLNAATDSAVWGINRPRLRDNLYLNAKLTYKKGHDLRDVINEHHIDLFNRTVARPHASRKAEGNLIHLIPLESQSLFDRASRQRSLFIAPGFLGDSSDPCSFMDNLAASFPGFAEALTDGSQVALPELCFRAVNDPCYNNFAVVKVVIPKGLHSSLRTELAMMGLDDESLFPGLDGLSRSLVQHHIMR